MRLLLAIFLGAASLSPAQEKNDFPVLCVEDFEGINIERTEYYDGNALWGLINGGADIYLEYGFDELAFQTVEWLEQHFRVEIYLMTDEEAAFGIYLYHTIPGSGSAREIFHFNFKYYRFRRGNEVND